jgi:membrane protease YdiL (CAAX protease family)
MLVAWPLLLFVSWIVAWLIDLSLRAHFHWDSQADTVYWITMKALLWVLPAIIAVRVFVRASVVDFMELAPARLRQGLIWGCGVGVALVVVTFLGKTLPSGKQARDITFSLVFLNAVAVAPLVEEIALRGFYLKLLEQSGRSFWISNALATLVFVAMHVPGWLFSGRFPSMMNLAQAMIPLAGLSLLFGWTKKRSASLYGAIIVHAVNNLYSAFYA